VNRGRGEGGFEVTDLDPFRREREEDADPKRQEAALAEVNGMEFLEVARVEFLQNRDKPMFGDIVPDHERDQGNILEIVNIQERGRHSDFDP
jgi:hypothetical protein